MSTVSNDKRPIERRIGVTEELPTLTEATRHLPRMDGKKVAFDTLWQWCRNQPSNWAARLTKGASREARKRCKKRASDTKSAQAILTIFCTSKNVIRSLS